MAVMNRRERERRRHRAEILDAAEAVFAEKGFHGSTIEDIAVRAEFAVGTLYNFFASKEQLYQSLIAQRVELMCAKGNKRLDEASDPVSFVRAYVKGKIELTEQYHRFLKIYTQERMGDRFSNNELWREKVGPGIQQLRERLADAFRGGIEQGLFRGDLTPQDMAIALDGLSDGFMFEWLIDPENFSFAEKLDVMLKMFFDGVRKK